MEFSCVGNDLELVAEEKNDLVFIKLCKLICDFMLTYTLLAIVFIECLSMRYNCGACVACSSINESQIIYSRFFKPFE